MKRHAGGEHIRTAILLPDEKLLMPLLSSIPEEYDKVNVTMGYPVAATPLPDFMNMLSELQKNAVRQEGKSLFYHASVRALVSHRYLKEIAGGECAGIIENIIRENRIYIPSDDPLFKESESEIIRKIFLFQENTKDVIEWQIGILKELDSVAEHPDSDFIYEYYKALIRLKELDLPLEKNSYFRLLKQITSLMTIPFKGEPLEGLQVMGPLEVRSLDFDNIIILSANEGLFPAAATAPSLIPYNLRLGFGLPTYELQDAIITGYIGLMLNYCQRFYNRQFLTRKLENSDILVKFDNLLRCYYDEQRQLTLGFPTVQYCADKLCMSPNYFGDLIKKTTGETASSYIRQYVIQRAQNSLAAGTSIAETASELGFEYPQHFSRMFKQQTGITPSEYCARFRKGAVDQ